MRDKEYRHSFGETIAATTSSCATVSADASANLLQLLKQA
jgi:hypothetical protein